MDVNGIVKLLVKEKTGKISEEEKKMLDFNMETTCFSTKVLELLADEEVKKRTSQK